MPWITPANSVEPLVITSPLLPMLTTPEELPASVVMALNGTADAEMSNVVSTVTTLDDEMLPKPEIASVPAEIVVAPA